MANRNFPASRVYGFSVMPVRLITKATIAGTGAVTIGQTTGGIKSITRLAVGIYRLQLDDNYASFISAKFAIKAPQTGSAVAATALVAGTQYEITSLGTTTQAQWVTAGVPAGITAAPGVTFLAAGTSSGTGSSKAVGQSGITSIEIAGDPQTMLNNQPFVQGQGGGYITFQCNGPTSSSVTTPIATDPASDSEFYIELLMNNSSIQ